jgi:hypothetical protein
MQNEECRMMNEAWRTNRSFIHHSAFLILTYFLTVLVAGCDSSPPTTQPSSVRDRQDAALRDPFGYSVDTKDEGDVSGGGIFHLDKEGLKRDTDHVLNP